MALPKRVVTNDDLSQIVDTTDEWIVPRTGIHTRHIAVNETCTDLGAAAGARALGLEEGGWVRDGKAIDPASIDMVICMTLTPDTAYPSQAALIRKRLKLENAVCYDLSAACSGCVYGISTADLLLSASAMDREAAAARGGKPTRNVLRRILVVGAERLSRLMDWTDRATCILFGDGAGAALLEWRDDEPGVLATYMENTDDWDRTLQCDSIHCTRSVPFAAAPDDDSEPLPEADPYMRMAGQAVFKFASSAMMRCTNEVLDRAGLTVDDITLFTPHQANERIIRYAAKKMKLPMERFQLSIDHTGNISGASALIALNEALMQGKLKTGDIALMVAFGGGLTAGGAVIRI